MKVHADWAEKFRKAAKNIMSIEGLTPTERCKLTDLVFDEIITEDKSNGYVCICFEAPEEQENNGQGQSGRGHHFFD